MTEPWVLMVSAVEADATARAAAAHEMGEWLARVGDGVALVTCHRAELYGVGSAPSLGSVRALSGEAAVDHLMRVACGLESVIVGEDEVLHQVREALSRARARQEMDPRLHRLFETAIAAGRKARSKRTASSGNLAQSAVAWLKAKADLADQRVVVAGAGRMGAALAHALADSGAELIIASRDPDRAVRIELARAKTDALPPIADISAPHAVPDAVRRRLNGSFLGIDDLYRRDAPLPGAYIEDAKRLVALKSAEYMAWLQQPR